jgi:hypothetical protein
LFSLPIHRKFLVGHFVCDAAGAAGRLVVFDEDVDRLVRDDVQRVEGAHVLVPHVADHEREQRPTDRTKRQWDDWTNRKTEKVFYMEGLIEHFVIV